MGTEVESLNAWTELLLIFLAILFLAAVQVALYTKLGGVW